MSGHDGRVLQISQLEVELANQRAKFDTWLVENAAMAGQSAYDDYVEQFRKWEEGMQTKLNDLRTSIARQPVTETPTLPTRNLDEQVADSVKDISINDFIKALMILAKSDPGFVGKLSQVIQRETQGTGYYNPMFPPPTTSQPPPVVIPSIPTFPPTNKAQIPPPAMYGAAPVRTTFIQMNATGARTVGPSSFQQPMYTQVTAHGAIPEGWVVDEPVPRHRPAPIPERQHLPKLPFKDFSQT